MPKRNRENRPKLTPRQNMLMEGILEGKSTRRAALDAGYSERTANHPEDLLGTKAMREAFAGMMPSIEKIAQRITEGLDAEETKFFQKDGIVTAERDVIAWGERRAYAELAATFRGLKVEPKNQTSDQPPLIVEVRFVGQPSKD